MKLTLSNVRSLKRDASPLYKRVCNYVIDEWGNYEDKVNIFTDVLYYANGNTKPADDITTYINTKWLPYAKRQLKKIAA